MSESRRAHPVQSPDHLAQLPPYAYSGRIVVVSADTDLPGVLRHLHKEKVLGFDTEAKPVFRSGENSPVAVIQFAGEDCVWIFQITRLRDPSRIREILEDGRVLKVGVAVHDDLEKIQRQFPFVPAGFVDIASLAARAGLKKRGLRNLCAELLKVRVSKGARLTNWAAVHLTPAQIRYAATDAWVSRALYFELRRRIEARSDV